MEDIGAHLRKDRRRTLHVFRGAAHHDGERGVLGFCDRARYRRVHHGDAVRRQRPAERPGSRRVGRAHVDDQRAVAKRGHGLEHHVAHHAAVGQHGDEDVGALRRGAHGRAVAVAGAVERLHGVASRGQVAGHRPTHGAEADEGYSFDANTSFAQRNATTAAGTPQ